MSRKPTSSKNRKGLRSMTPSAIERAALADPDARPLTAADLKHMRRTPRIKIIRRAVVERFEITAASLPRRRAA